MRASPTIASRPDAQITRTRISSKMAFPIGYEFLRDYFQDLPHWAEARFYFSSHPTVRASQFASMLRSQKPYPILRVAHAFKTYARRPPTHWHFTIYPVLRDLKSVARRALVAGPLAILQDFVARSPTYWSYHNQAEAIFDPAEGTCRAELAWPLDSTEA